MQVSLSPQLKREIAGIKEYGYRSEREFIEDAVKHWVFKLKGNVKGVKEFTPTVAQKRALSRAERNLKQGKTFSYDELVRKLGFTN